jgi:uncharacterized Zn finger protein
MNKRKKIDDWEDWVCPRCGGTEQWFDRIITTNEDGTEEGMTNRCVNCGISTDEWVRKGKKK